MHRLAAALLLLMPMSMSTVAVASDWTVGAVPGDGSDVTAAGTVSDEGHRLYLWSRHGSGRHQVIAELHLAEGTAFAGLMPVYRIDDGPLYDTDLIRRAGDARGSLWGHVAEQVAFWLVWASTEDVVRPGDPLDAWLNGRRLQVSYRAADGTERTIDFSLEGSADPILAATGIRRD